MMPWYGRQVSWSRAMINSVVIIAPPMITATPDHGARRVFIVRRRSHIIVGASHQMREMYLALRAISFIACIPVGHRIAIAEGSSPSIVGDAAERSWGI